VAATSTTIQGVSILTKKRQRRVDIFDITLSNDGIEVLRPGRTAQHMGWDRVSQWEIEERPDHLLLTLRGDGAVTPLVVTGWSLDDLAVVMREATSGAPRTEPTAPRSPRAEAPTPPAVASAAPEPQAAASATDVAPQPEPRSPAPRPAQGAETQQTKPTQPPRRARSPWRSAVTVVLLAALATAVVLVLLQSAGVINWGFLGPTA